MPLDMVQDHVTCGRKRLRKKRRPYSKSLTTRTSVYGRAKVIGESVPERILVAMNIESSRSSTRTSDASSRSSRYHLADHVKNEALNGILRRTSSSAAKRQ